MRLRRVVLMAIQMRLKTQREMKQKENDIDIEYDLQRSENDRDVKTAWTGLRKGNARDGEKIGGIIDKAITESSPNAHDKKGAERQHGAMTWAAKERNGIIWPQV